MKIFCERLRELRLEKGLSMLQLGEALNVSDAAISRWENEQHIPNIEYLRDIAKFFDVSADYLIGLSDFE